MRMFMSIESVEHSKLSMADYIGFSPLPVVCLLPYFVPNCPVGVNLAGFGWTLLAGQEVCRRNLEEGHDLTKRRQLLGIKFALGSSAISSLFNALSAVTGGSCLSNCALALMEGFSLHLLWNSDGSDFKRKGSKQQDSFLGKGHRLGGK